MVNFSLPDILGRWFWPIVVVLLLVQAGLAVDAAWEWSPTHDEYWHLPLGVFYWQTADWRVDPINPPLVRLWASLPLFLSGTTIELPPELGWPDNVPTAEQVGDAFHEQHKGSYRGEFFFGRLMMIPLASLTGLILAGWSRRWYGDASGLLAAALWACCPTVLAHGLLVAHDLPATLGSFATVAACVSWRMNPTWRRALAWGVILGLALLTKLTAVFVLPICGAVWIVLPREGPSVGWPVVLRQTLIGLSAAWVVLTLQFGSAGPLPMPYLAEWEALREVLGVQHPVFLNGEWGNEGFRTYYLWALWWKLPTGMWICLALAAAMVVKALVAKDQENSLLIRRSLLLVIGFLVFFVPASFSGNQLGIRYILPAFPFLMLFASQAAGWWRPDASRGAKILLVILFASLPLSLRHHPSHLAYFNALAGGPAGGIHLLADSNLDWGQDLYRLRSYLKLHHIEGVKLAYFGSVRPWLEGLPSELPPGHSPEPGWYALSANFVQGRPHALRLEGGGHRAVNLDEFGYFRFFEPVARIGDSILLYHLSQEDVDRYLKLREELLADEELSVR
jgi:hypothetical protein